VQHVVDEPQSAQPVGVAKYVVHVPCTQTSPTVH
jgi:hypothetical protein